MFVELYNLQQNVVRNLYFVQIFYVTPHSDDERILMTKLFSTKEQNCVSFISNELVFHVFQQCSLQKKSRW